MAGEMFGGPIGTSAAIRDMANLSQMSRQNFEVAKEQQLLPLQQESAQAQVRLRDAQRVNQLSQAIWHKSQAEAAGQKMQDDRSIGEVISGISDGKPVTGQTFLDASGELSKIGRGRAALEAAKMGEQLLARENAAQANKTNAARADIALTKESFDVMGRVLSNVKDDAGMEAAADAYEAAMPGKKAPWRGHPYNKQEVEEAILGSMSVSQRLSAMQRKATEDETKRWHDSQLKHQQVMEGIAKDREKRERAKMEQDKKIGRVAAEPKEELINEAKGLIKGSYPNITDSDQLNLASKDVARAAMDIRLHNPGKSMREALSDALNQSRKDLRVQEEDGKASLQYKAEGMPGTRSNPIQLTDSIIQGKKFLPNTIYQLSNGAIAYMKNGKMVVETP